MVPKKKMSTNGCGHWNKVYIISNLCFLTRTNDLPECLPSHDRLICIKTIHSLYAPIHYRSVRMISQTHSDYPTIRRLVPLIPECLSEKIFVSALINADLHVFNNNCLQKLADSIAVGNCKVHIRHPEN